MTYFQQLYLKLTLIIQFFKNYPNQIVSYCYHCDLHGGFSHLMSIQPLEDLVKIHILLYSLSGDPTFCIYNELPGDSDTAGISIL